MEHDFVEISPTDIKCGICDDLHEIIKLKHGVDIYTMDSEELKSFLNRIIQKQKRPSSLALKLLWWSLCQVSHVALRTLVPMIYMMYKLHMF